MPFSHSKPASRTTLLLKEQVTLTPRLALQKQRNYSAQFLFSDSRSLATLNNVSLFRADLEALTISLLTTPSLRTISNLCLTRMVENCLFHQLQTLAHFPPQLPLHPLNPTLGISMKFLPTVILKKKKKCKTKKKSKVLVLSPRGSMRAGTPVGRDLCLSSLHLGHLLTPGCKNREGQEPAQDPKWAASHDLVEPQAASFNLATVDEQKKKQKTNKQKHCQVKGENLLNSIPVLTPWLLQILH